MLKEKAGSDYTVEFTASSEWFNQMRIRILSTCPALGWGLK